MAKKISKTDLKELDQEEKEILEAYESGKMLMTNPSPEELEGISAAARNTVKKEIRPGNE